jgi:hypothetical protein
MAQGERHMVYRRKGSGEPASSEEPPSSEEASSRREAGRASANTPRARCSVCGRRTFLFSLPGQNEKYCFECSADIATSILLRTEIDAATLAGQNADPLVAEFAQLSTRLLARAQSVG